jgi:hypothetical protein
MTNTSSYPEISIGTFRINAASGHLLYRSGAPGAAPNMITVMGEVGGLNVGVTCGRTAMEAAIGAIASREIAEVLIESAAIADGTGGRASSLGFRPERTSWAQVNVVAEAGAVTVLVTNGVSVIGSVVSAAIARELAFALNTGATMLDDLAVS